MWMVWIFSRPIRPIFFVDWQYSGILMNQELAVANHQPWQVKFGKRTLASLRTSRATSMVAISKSVSSLSRVLGPFALDL